jgi:hypothetical protein
MIDHQCVSSIQQFQVGDHVVTPDGPGRVAFWRFGPPTYTQVVAYSVKLDARQEEYNYSGTMYPADRVLPATGDT